MVGSFGEKLKYLREERGINQTELGKCLHMTQRKISYIECGKVDPSLDDIKAICIYFSVSSDFLLSLPRGLNYKE